jgi:hypothetical protein
VQIIGTLAMLIFLSKAKVKKTFFGVKECGISDTNKMGTSTEKYSQTEMGGKH